MDIFDRLRLGRFYYDAPDDAPGGGKTLEQVTNEKLGISGNGEDPPPGDGGGGGDGDDPPPADPPEPDGKEDPPSGGDGEDGVDPPPKDDDAPSDGDGEDPDGGDETPFYDPDVHVEGKAAHSNKFPTREKAEFAAIQKAEMLSDKLEEMEEDGVDRGAIRLPGALGNDPERLKEMTQLETIAGMDDDELRSFLNESDGSRQRLDIKHQKAQKAHKAREYKNDLEEAQGQLFDGLKNLMDVEEIQQNLNKFNDPEKGKELIRAKVDAKVSAELEDDISELEQWIDDVDSGEIELSFKEFDEQKQKKVKNIEDREQELREKYESALDTYDKVLDLSEQVEESSELTAEQKSQKIWSAFDGMQKDLGELAIEQNGTPDLAILAETPEARAELVAAKNWAFQNAEDYNGLMHESDWREALEVGWPSHKDKVRAGRQADELDEDADGKGGDDDDDIPSPGPQDKLYDGEGGVHSRNKSSLDKLEELTNQRVG